MVPSRILRRVVVYALIAMAVGNLARYLYLDDLYFRQAPRAPNPSTGAIYRATFHHGIPVYLTRSQWLWFGSPEFWAWSWCGSLVAATGAYLLNRRWKIIKNANDR